MKKKKKERKGKERKGKEIDMILKEAYSQG